MQGRRWRRRRGKRRRRKGKEEEEEEEEAEADSSQTVAKITEAEKRTFVALDFSPRR